MMGKLIVTGIGPGDAAHMTVACADALRTADVIVGYTGYTKLIKPLFPDKEYIETGMTQEMARCQEAVALADAGCTVCVVSSGDSGVYGMAGLLLELAGESPSFAIAIVPGVTAALSGAALLGAPIGHDFAVISLSDLLTPWDVIEKRLHAAAMGDFAIALYNPGSHKRAGHLRTACGLLLETLPPDRLCGIARCIAREGESMQITTLSALFEHEGDMNETIFIGNSQTKLVGGRMVTPRGYRHA